MRIVCSLVTNGKRFEETNYCKNFFNKLKDKNINKINVFVTIDKFHRNYEDINNTILDNLLIFKSQINLKVQSTVTTNPLDNISIKFIKKYSQLGIEFPINRYYYGIVPYINLKSSG